MGNAVNWCLCSSLQRDSEEIVKQAMVKRAPNHLGKYLGSRVRIRRMILEMSQEELCSYSNKVQKWRTRSQQPPAQRYSSDSLTQLAGCSEPVEIWR
jgi:hypothetical protein